MVRWVLKAEGSQLPLLEPGEHWGLAPWGTGHPNPGGVPMALVRWGWSLLSQMGGYQDEKGGSSIPRERAEAWSRWAGAGRMLWGAGLQGSWWLVLRTMVLRPAGDSAGDLWSSRLNLGPFVVMLEASLMHNSPVVPVTAPDAQRGYWVLTLVTSSPRGVTTPLLCPVGPGSLKSHPACPVVHDSANAAPGTLPSCPSHVVRAADQTPWSPHPMAGQWVQSMGCSARQKFLVLPVGKPLPLCWKQ